MLRIVRRENMVHGADMGEYADYKILVVDDDRFIRNTIRLMLRAIDRFVLEEAEDGDEALVKTDQLKPDVVLCDIAMPRMGGLLYVAQLRRHPDPKLRQTPVVILTGAAEEETVRDAVRLRINGFLVKPFSPATLNGHLRKILIPRSASSAA